jgi:hypothetical protein
LDATAIPRDPVTNAIFAPSGDQMGYPRGLEINLHQLCGPPTAGAIQSLDTSPENDEQAMYLPSGDQSGAGGWGEK